MNRPFDFAAAPLFRVLLIRVAEDEHLFVITTHHAACDDWSAGILLHELARLYGAARLGSPANLPPLGFQYADFARQLDSEAGRRRADHDREFWHSQLTAPPGTGRHVKEDRKPPERKTFRGAHERVRLPQSVLQSLLEISRRERTTLFMTLLGAMQSLLHCYGEETPISVGSCVANRDTLEIMKLVGPFANVVVLRTAIDPLQPFCQVLCAVRETALRVYSHQDLPFGELIRSLGRAEPARHNPFFQLLFVLQNAPRQEWRMPGLELEPYTLDAGTSVYDLCLAVKTEEGLDLDLNYNTDLFVRETARRLLRDYQTVLQAVARNPQLRAGELLASPACRVFKASA